MSKVGKTMAFLCVMIITAKAMKAKIRSYREIRPRTSSDKVIADIMDACKSGNIAVLSSLADGKPILNEIEKNGVSPLVVASSNGHTGIVRHILQHEHYVISPDILAHSASVAKSNGHDKVRSLLTLYYIKYIRYSA